MLDYYKKATLIGMSLLLISAVLAIVCISRTHFSVNLLASEDSAWEWWLYLGTDQDKGGGSTIRVNDTRFSLDFDVHLDNTSTFPFANLSFVFGSEPGDHTLVDLSRFQSVSFSAKCSPHNVLTIWVSTVHPTVTQLDDFDTYRTSETYFSCDQEWREFDVELSNLKTPDWWLTENGLDLSERDYDLTGVRRVSFGNTYQSPQNVDSKAQIQELILHGREPRYLYGLAGAMLLLWGGYIFWLFHAHSRALVEDLKSRLLKDRPLIAYQQLSVEPTQDKVRSALLRYLSTEYANSDLNLDTVENALGISRTKVNNILREEFGYTFTAYLNKLRLTEAVRLLTEAEGANVGEIAYSVGYNNVSYFNKLFKEEYGCTPKTFKSMSLGEDDR